MFLTMAKGRERDKESKYLPVEYNLHRGSLFYPLLYLKFLKHRGCSVNSYRVNIIKLASPYVNTPQVCKDRVC